MKVEIEIVCACGQYHHDVGLPVPGHPGLLVVECPPRPCTGNAKTHWSITHARSGLAVLFLDHAEQAPAAVEFMDEWLGPVDWTLTGRELREQVGSNGRAVQEGWAEVTGTHWSSPRNRTEEAYDR